MISMTQLEKNLTQVKERIAEAALRAARPPEDVRLVAVTKRFPVQAIAMTWQLGQRDFAENRPEEGATKIPQVTQVLPDAAQPTWHMIGHIQRRKARHVIAHFDIVHSIDRLAVAEKLSRLAEQAQRDVPILLECNVSGEKSKYGYAVSGWEQDSALRTAFYREVEAILALPRLHLAGLMTMAPIVEDPESVRPVFASLQALLGALQERFPDVPWRHLSMGMTDDFEVAVEQGATLVRIGRAIFGDYYR